MKKVTDFFNEGDKVLLFPGDSQRKIAKILAVNKRQYVFELLSLGNVNYSSELNVGDIIVYPLESVIMKKVNY